MKKLLALVLVPFIVRADVWLEDGRPQEAAQAAAVSVTVTNQAGGAQTPWAQDVDAAGHGLTNAVRLNFGAASISEDTNRAERPLILSHTFAGGGGPASAGLYPWNALDGQVLAWNASAGWWLPATPAAGAGDNLGNHVAVSNLDMAGFALRSAGDLVLSVAGGGVDTNVIFLSGAGSPQYDGRYVYAESYGMCTPAWTNDANPSIYFGPMGGVWYFGDYAYSSQPNPGSVADIVWQTYMGGMDPAPTLATGASGTLALNPHAAGSYADVLASGGDGTVFWRPAGTGDMARAVYDTDGNGVVDAATLGQTWAGLTCPFTGPVDAGSPGTLLASHGDGSTYWAGGLTATLGDGVSQYAITNIVVSNGLIQQIDFILIGP